MGQGEVKYLWMELQREETSGTIIVGVCYRHPNLKDEKELDLLSHLEMAARQGNVFIVGDFNYRNSSLIKGVVKVFFIF